MRYALALLLLASPAAAWEFTATPLCTLTHTNDQGTLVITHDPALPEYTLTITLTAADWDAAPTFRMGFDGPRRLTIGTDQHVVSGPELFVKDRGFGNVLDGLQFNDVVLAASGDTLFEADLSAAAEPVAAFRRCPAPATS